MRRTLLVLAIACCAAVVVTAPGSAASKPWYSYGLFNDRVAVEGGDGAHSARLSKILLPGSFGVERRGARNRTYLAFGPVGACRSTGSIRVALVSSSASDAETVRDDLLPSGTSYGSGTNRDGAWGIVNAGGGKLRGAYVRPTGIADVWVVVRVATTPSRSCHTGGYRESLAHPLSDALAATAASGY